MLSCQSKHGLVGSSTKKQENFYLGSHIIIIIIIMMMFHFCKLYIVLSMHMLVATCIVI